MNKQDLINYVQKKHEKQPAKVCRVGDTVRVHVKITEGSTTRVQVFEGTVISYKGTTATKTFTVRKISFGVGVERVFPVASPSLKKVEILRSGQARRSRLYYLRNRVGRAARLDEKETTTTKTKKSESKKKTTTPAAPPAEPALAATKK